MSLTTTSRETGQPPWRNLPPPPRPKAARMGPADVVRVGGSGLRARPMRVFLSALGIAIGIAAMIGVVGISTSSTNDLNERLAALGTNLLTVSPGESFDGGKAHLPTTSLAMIGDIPEVESVSALGKTSAKIYRNDHVPVAQSGGLRVTAARTDLLSAIGAELTDGSWLNAATSKYPAVVLGSHAAEQLGIHYAGPEVKVWLGGHWFTVVGLLAPNELLPDLDSNAMVGWAEAEKDLGFDGYPTSVYTRAEESAVNEVQAKLGATANPEFPSEVDVSRPSDVLAAKEATDDTLSGLLLGLGGVSLLVGGVGVANTMVISVLERRSEIGLRRSLGATRGQIRTQFLAEALLLSVLGGVGGVLLGIGVTIAYASYQGMSTVVPVWAMAGGVGATLVIGGLAGFYPALRAARLPPTEALASV
ncbi:putative ABC transport system permease protein [Streptomyces pseudovenezuelae]|uniref:ABC transport system permease protein n=2 Tax=Streptomyces pseudovenezuelae TaxID=67350 RepID=A0ABT6LZ61_9ACTN|nr:putative ABC transport system permease protein [Streptomyces pseudovenezuelae]